MKSQNEKIRELIHTDEFDEYFDALDERTKDKFVDCMEVLETIYVLSTKFVKKIVESGVGIYELRVSVGFNEHRTILFSADHENIIEAKQIVLLNGFLKKDNKDYKKQVKKAINILENLSL